MLNKYLELGSVIGGLTGFISGNIAEYKPNKSPKRINVPDKPKWNGPYFQGSEEEAKEILLTSSKLYNVETSYYFTSEGYYFEPIQGHTYGWEWDAVPGKIKDIISISDTALILLAQLEDIILYIK